VKREVVTMLIVPRLISMPVSAPPHPRPLSLQGRGEKERAMSNAGYSGTPLVKKLGIVAGMRVHLRSAPADYPALLGDLPEGVTLLKQLKGTLNFIQLFVTERSVLETELPRSMEALDRDGMIWISWPKKASKVPTDITEQTIRDVALPMGLVDIKVCAVDEVWSGLKLVVRKELRGKR